MGWGSTAKEVDIQNPHQAEAAIHNTQRPFLDVERTHSVMLWCPHSRKILLGPMLVLAIEFADKHSKRWARRSFNRTFIPGLALLFPL